MIFHWKPFDIDMLLSGVRWSNRTRTSQPTCFSPCSIVGNHTKTTILRRSFLGSRLDKKEDRLDNGAPVGASTSEPNKAYSHTLLLPRTSFPLKFNVDKTEAQVRKRTTVDLYTWQASQQDRGIPFVLHDGPPYANGALHMGHALNKILKDIVVRRIVIEGRRVNYIPGWDCHGLPIELKALQELQKDTKSKHAALEPSNKSVSEKSGLTVTDPPPGTLDTLQLRQFARGVAQGVIHEQKEVFQRFGVLADWENAWTTMDPAYEIRQLNIFAQLAKHGLIQRRFRPVNWSPSSHTALAEAEIEYNDDHKSRSIYLKFRLRTSPCKELKELLGNDSRVHLLVWTTTPWTIPANQAICINPKLEYVATKSTAGEILIMARARLEHLREIVKQDLKINFKVQGSDLINSSYDHPFTNQQLPVLAANWVNSESGTGVVHAAPAHGMDDYETCQGAAISDVVSLLDDRGRFIKEKVKDWEIELAGEAVTDGGKAVERIIQYLYKQGALVEEVPIVHRYPYDWRTKRPLIQRATAQWFANVSGIKSKALDALRNVKMVPESGLNRLSHFVQGRNEWCISRQRAWGVPIPALYRRSTGEAILSEESVRHIIRILEEKGTNAWWTEDVDVFVHPSLKENRDDLIKGTDTLDVWFDSGVSWTSLKPKKNGKKQADLYLEGSDQHRGWFQSSLLTSVATQDVAPFETLFTHGFVLDEDGHKMSKSVGNVIDPRAIIEGQKNIPALGADGLRFWSASVESVKDVHLGPTILSTVAQSLRKIRNTARFLLSNLGTYTPKLADNARYSLTDKYLMYQLYQFEVNIRNHHSAYAFNRVIQDINHFTNSTLSSFYFDIIKDPLYADTIESGRRKAIVDVLAHILRVYTRALAPIIPHLAEEIYEHAPESVFPGERQPSVFMVPLTSLDDKWNNSDAQEQMEPLLELRRVTLNLLERARADKVLRNSLEAGVDIKVLEGINARRLLMTNLAQLKLLFIVSEANFRSDVDAGWGETATWQYTEEVKVTLPGMTSGSTEEALCAVSIRPAAKEKCPRCWMYTRDAQDDTCRRCRDAVVAV